MGRVVRRLISRPVFPEAVTLKPAGGRYSACRFSRLQLFLPSLLSPPTVGKGTLKVHYLSYTLIQTAEGCCALGAQRAERSGGPLIFLVLFASRQKERKARKRRNTNNKRRLIRLIKKQLFSSAVQQDKRWKRQNRQEPSPNR